MSADLGGDSLTHTSSKPWLVPLSSPDVSELEEAFALDAIRSGWLAPAGPQLPVFEAELAALCGRARAVALSSGTAALHLALLEIGVGPGSVVLVPTLTFVATANAVVYTGATPVFVDSDPATGNIAPSVLQDALAALRKEGVAVSAVITVDLLGKCADYDAIEAICRDFEVPMVEDAAESLGASFASRPAGSFGVISVLSFNGNKIMTTSGGGCLLTNDGDLADRVRYRSTQARQPVSHYEHTELGFNYRMSNVLAAIGRAQLRRLGEMMHRRRAMRDHYSSLFEGVTGVRIFQRDGDGSDNCWLTAVVVEPDESGWRARDLGSELAAQGIECRPLWKPMHQQPLFRDARSFLTGVSARLFETGLTLPSGSALSNDQINHTDRAVTNFLDAFK